MEHFLTYESNFPQTLAHHPSLVTRRPRTFCFYPRLWHRLSITYMTLSLLQNFLYNPHIWDKKMRIAVLTLATFAALC